MIRIEDEIEDVIGKAMRGRGLSPAELARAARLPESQVSSLLEGRSDAASVRAVAKPLGLHAAKLLALAEGARRPSAQLPEGVARFNTPFPLPGYAEMTVNSYLIHSAGEAVAIDTGADARPLLDYLRAKQLRLRACLLTHTHRDHVAALPELRRAAPDMVAYTPAGEPLPGCRPLQAGASIHCGRLSLEPRETPGHSPGALSFVLRGAPEPLVFVGDALFALSIGKVPPEAYDDARQAIRTALLAEPDATVVCPGHGPLTTVGQEKAHNPFF